MKIKSFAKKLTKLKVIYFTQNGQSILHTIFELDHKSILKFQSLQTVFGIYGTFKIRPTLMPQKLSKVSKNSSSELYHKRNYCSQNLKKVPPDGYISYNLFNKAQKIHQKNHMRYKFAL